MGAKCDVSNNFTHENFNKSFSRLNLRSNASEQSSYFSVVSFMHFACTSLLKYSVRSSPIRSTRDRPPNCRSTLPTATHPTAAALRSSIRAWWRWSLRSLALRPRRRSVGIGGPRSAAKAQDPDPLQYTTCFSAACISNRIVDILPLVTFDEDGQCASMI